MCEVIVDQASQERYYGRPRRDVRAQRAVGYLSGSNEAGMSVTHVAKDAIMAKSRRRWILLLALLCGAGLAWGGWAWWKDRRYKGAMEEIEQEIMVGRHASACRSLENLLSWKADSNGGIVYLLGSCELARGRIKAAGEAWSRVAPGSEFSEKAIRGRMRLAHESGQFAVAEQIINGAALDPRNDRTALLVMLVPILSEQGRIDEAERLIEERWEQLNALAEGSLEPAIKLVLQHVELGTKPTLVETVRAVLDHAYKLAPDDDRVWLGRANLAIRTGADDEAERWLDACQRRRPDDVPVWRARLTWAMATKRIDVVKQALTHVAATESNSALRYRVNAWLAAQRGDIADEQKELELLIAADPAALTALERLAELAEKDGLPARAAELLRKKTEINQSLALYLKLHERKQPIRNAVKLARLAEQLGRQFEARVFRAIATSEETAR
jgi:enediyne biosynthesis protein E4